MWKKTGKKAVKLVLNAAAIILLLSGAVYALEVDATVDRQQIGMNESLTLTVTIIGGPGEVNTASIGDFDVASRGSSTNIQIVNGKVSKRISYSYQLLPRKKGRLFIPPLEVTSHGNVYRTKKIQIVVSDSPVRKTSERDLFAEASISDQKPFAGQQVIYNFKVYRAVQVANMRFQEPDFTGFTAKKAGKDNAYRTNINGREYVVNELNYVLTPIKEGTITILPAVINGDVVYQKKDNKRSPLGSFFNDPFFGGSEIKSRTIRSNELTIKVRPLPEYHGNTVFSGLVGEFSIHAEIDENQLKVGESTTMSVTLSGKGNVMDAPEPEINAPDAFKVYKDTPVEEVNIDSKGISGKKVFRTALVPVIDGDYTIDSVKLNYFDTAENRYKIITTDPIEIRVEKSDKKEKVGLYSPTPAQGLPKIKKNRVEFTGRDILPLKQGLDLLENKARMPVYQFLLFLLFPILLFAFVKLMFIYLRKNKSTAKEMAEQAERAIKKAYKTELTGEAFLSLLYLALVSAIHSAAGTKGASLTCMEAEKILSGKGYTKEVSDKASELLSRIESAKYSGSDIVVERNKELLADTKALLKDLLP